jgi:hypothetical protein
VRHGSLVASAVALITLALLITGCGKSSQKGSATGGAGPDSSALTTTGTTGWLSDQEPNLGVRYGSFAVACDSARAMTKRALGRYAGSAEWSVRTEPFLYHDAVVEETSPSGQSTWTVIEKDTNAVVVGPHMAFENHTEDVPSLNKLQDAFLASGWVTRDWYQADGADGTAFAMACREALCYVDATWRGQDEADTTYVPPAGIRIELRVVPRSPGAR